MHGFLSSRLRCWSQHCSRFKRFSVFLCCSARILLPEVFRITKRSKCISQKTKNLRAYYSSSSSTSSSSSLGGLSREVQMLAELLQVHHASNVEAKRLASSSSCALVIGTPSRSASIPSVMVKRCASLWWPCRRAKARVMPPHMDDSSRLVAKLAVCSSFSTKVLMVPASRPPTPNSCRRPLHDGSTAPRASSYG
jgi:hypothetical protein